MTATADAFFGIFGMTRVEQPVILNVVVPIEVTSNVNRNEHFMARTRRVTKEHNAVEVALHKAWVLGGQPDLRGIFAGAHRLDLGARVTFLRPYKDERGHLDTDNASNSVKNVRDYVAGFLGLDDRTDRIHWRVFQVKAHTPYDSCVQPKCRTHTGTKSHKLCLRCKAVKPDCDLRIRIEILPASDVNPLLTAVRELRRAAVELLELAKVAGYVRSATYDNAVDALSTADALATFDPKELYR